MPGKPNPDDFSTVEFPGEYEVTVEVVCTITETVKADTASDAADIIEKQITNDGLDVSEVDDVRFLDTRPKPTMYRVIRDGRKYQVSRLRPGDIPRDPDERGF